MTTSNNTTNNTINTLDFVDLNETLVNAATHSSIQEEVNSLISETQNKIGRFEAADEWIAANLTELPELIKGSVFIRYQDARGFIQFKKQSLSESIWIIAVKQVQYHLGINKELLTSAIVNWVNDNVYKAHEVMGNTQYEKVTVVGEQCNAIVSNCVSTMTGSIVSRNLTRKVVRLQAGNNITTKVFEITAEFANKLEELIVELRERASMTCRPLQHQPQDWTDAKTGIAEGANIKLVKNSRVKSDRVSTNVLNAVNKLQGVKFTLHPAMVDAARDMVCNRALFQNNHSGYFTEKELNDEAYELYSEIISYAGKEFYFPITLDQRGRMYYRGGLISPQGVDFCKAACQFAHGKKLGKTGVRALKIHTANVCGQDKLSLQDRIEWVNKNVDLLCSIKTHRDVRKHLKGADTFQALVACLEVGKLIEYLGRDIESKAADFVSNLVCHQDGTCNGLQHTAAITGDRATAVAVNCVPSSAVDEPADVYGIVAKQAEEFADGTALELIKKYGRNMAKNPVMITSYGATLTTIVSNLAKFLASKGEDVGAAQDIGDAYKEAIDTVAGAVTQLTEATAARVGFAVENGMKQFAWRTPDGFVAATRYEDDEAFAVRVGNFYIRKRGMGKAPVDARKTAQAMTPNFVHSIDATHLRMVINSCAFELVTVHDSIGSHAADFFQTSTAIRETFHAVHTHNPMHDLFKSMGQPIPEFPRVGEYSSEEALQSSYIFS